MPHGMGLPSGVSILVPVRAYWRFRFGRDEFVRAHFRSWPT